MLVGSSEQAGACPILVLSSSSRFLVSLGSLLRALLWSSDALSQPAPACRASHWLHKRETVIGHPRSLTSHPTPSTDLPSALLRYVLMIMMKLMILAIAILPGVSPNGAPSSQGTVGTDRYKYGSAHIATGYCRELACRKSKVRSGPTKSRN